MTEETFHTGRRVPRWDGRLEMFSRYKFDVNMYIKGVKKSERYVVGPHLVLHVGPRPRTALEDWDKLETVDEIAEDTGKTR